MEELRPGSINQVVDHDRLNRFATPGDPLYGTFRLALAASHVEQHQFADPCRAVMPRDDAHELGW